MDSGCNCKRLIIFLCLASFLLFIHHVQSQNIYFPPKLCSITGNYTSNDQFKANRDALLLSLISNGTNGGYFNNTVGSSPDTIYGLVDCRGDISKKICYDCLVKIMEAPQVCPNDTSVAFRSEYCILHYSNARFFDQVDKTFYRIASVYDVIIDPRYYYYGARLQALLNNLTTSASRAQLRYSTAIASYKNSTNIYGLAQCTRDLSHQNCFSCLNDMASWIPDNCKNTTQCWVYSTTCYIRYAQHQFYGPHLQSPLPQPYPNKIEENDGNKKVKSIVVIVVPIIGGAFVICAIITWRRKNRGERRPQQNHGPHDISESLHFELDTIRTSTNDFSNSNKLGHGGFGEVYKGELPDGIEVAVKRLSVNSGQGSQEFRNEVVLLYRFLHRNLVKLLGYCSTEEEKAICEFRTRFS